MPMTYAKMHKKERIEKEKAEAEAELLHKSQPKSKLVIIPEMSHILKDAPADRMENFATYNQPDLPINKQLVKEIISFVLN